MFKVLRRLPAVLAPGKQDAGLGGGFGGFGGSGTGFGGGGGTGAAPMEGAPSP